MGMRALLSSFPSFFILAADATDAPPSDHPPPSARLSSRLLAAVRPSSSPSAREPVKLKTHNILFIVAGAFVGLDKLVTARISKGSIGFTSKIVPSKTGFGSNTSGGEGKEGKEERDEAERKREEESRVLEMVEPGDLANFGLIPECVLPFFPALFLLLSFILSLALTLLNGRPQVHRSPPDHRFPLRPLSRRPPARLDGAEGQPRRSVRCDLRSESD
jgi:hypothetical protein